MNSWIIFIPKLVTKNNKVCSGEIHTHVHIYDVINVHAMRITGVVLRSEKYNTPNICIWIWCILYNIYVWLVYMGDFWFKWMNCVHHYCTSLRYSKRIFKQEKYDTYVIIISSAPSHPHKNRHYHSARTYMKILTANKSLGRKKILSFSITISGIRAYLLDS